MLYGISCVSAVSLVLKWNDLPCGFLQVQYSFHLLPKFVINSMRKVFYSGKFLPFYFNIVSECKFYCVFICCLFSWVGLTNQIKW